MPEPGMALRIIKILKWPRRKAGDILDLRRLRRLLPSVHRRIMNTPNGVRIETDAEYLARLRLVEYERYGE
jgi:hypothetical protein